MKSSLSILGAAVLFLGACATTNAGTTTKESSAVSSAMYTVLVSARFKSSDPAANKKAHDEVAAATKELAMSKGDVAHKVVKDPADPQSFLAIDVWTNLEGMQAHFADPKFQAGLGTIFDGPPTVRVFKTLAGGTQWGELSLAPGTLFVTVEAPFAGTNDQEILAAHNRVAEGGRQAAQSLGDIAHLAYVKQEDSKQFMAIDLWTNPDGMKKFFSDPQAQQAFGSLFSAPPKVTVYAATDYYQW